MEKRELSYTVGGNVNYAATMHNCYSAIEVPQKTKNRVAIWSSNPTPGHISRQNFNLKRYIHPPCSQQHCLQQPRHGDSLHAHRQRDGGGDAVHVCNETLLSHKEGWNQAICSNTDGPRECHTKRDKYHTISLTCGIQNITQMNIFTKQTQNRTVAAKRCRRGMDWEFGIPRCRLLYIEWVKN